MKSLSRNVYLRSRLKTALSAYKQVRTNSLREYKLLTAGPYGTSANSASYCLMRVRKLAQIGPRRLLPLPMEVTAIEVFNLGFF